MRIGAGHFPKIVLFAFTVVSIAGICSVGFAAPAEDPYAKLERRRIAIVITEDTKIGSGQLTTLHRIIAGVRKEMSRECEVIDDAKIMKELGSILRSSQGTKEYREEIDALKIRAYDLFVEQVFIIRGSSSDGSDPAKAFKIEIGFCNVSDPTMRFGSVKTFLVSDNSTDENTGSICRMMRSKTRSGVPAAGALDYSLSFHEFRTRKPFSFSSLKNKPVVICVMNPSRGEMTYNYPEMKNTIAALRSRFPGLAVVIGIAGETMYTKNKWVKAKDEPGLKDMIKDGEFPYPLLDFSDYSPNKKFSVTTILPLPMYVFADGKGNVSEMYDINADQNDMIATVRRIRSAESGSTIPLDIAEAARINDADRVKALLLNDADLSVVQGGYSALDWAMYNENQTLFEEILERTDKNSRVTLNAAYLAASNDNLRFFTMIARYNGKFPPANEFLFYTKADKMGFDGIKKYIEEKSPEIRLFGDRNFDYRKVLAAGIKPGISPSYEFPVSGQGANTRTCELFCMKHVLRYKYNESYNVSDWEKRYGKGKSEAWWSSDIAAIMDGVNITYEFLGKSEGLFFYYLYRGEPVISERELGADRHSHSVVAYSFDEKGIWLSDSANGKRWNIDYETFLKNKWFTLRVIRKK